MRRLTQQERVRALAAFQERRQNPPALIENDSLPAGADMYYYCESCGHISDIKPEHWFLTPPRMRCGECEALKAHGLL